MKRFFLAAMILGAVSSWAQDILVKKNGNTIQAKLLRVGNTEIEYKRWSNQNGPTFTLPLTDLSRIKYANGEEDVFETGNSASTSTDAPKPTDPVKVTSAADNDGLIAQFNHADVTFKPKSQKDKEAKHALGVLAIAPGSTLAGEDLTVSIEQVKAGFTFDDLELGETGVVYGRYSGEETDKPKFFAGRYVIILTNNTDHNIFVDKGMSFRIEPDGTYKSYYDVKKQTSVNQNSGTSAGLNLGAVAGAIGLGGPVGVLAGGINVGGGRSNGVSSTFVDDRVIVIPPHARVPLSQDLATRVSKGKFVINQMAEYYADFPISLIAGLKEGEVRYGSETTDVRKYVISYTDDPEFRSLKQQEFGVYPSHIVGLRIPGRKRDATGLIPEFKKFCKRYVVNRDPEAIIVMDTWIPEEVRRQ